VEVVQGQRVEVLKLLLLLLVAEGQPSALALLLLNKEMYDLFITGLI
jgi:hypothetical protein